jgi:hypothetical protein
LAVQSLGSSDVGICIAHSTSLEVISTLKPDKELIGKTTMIEGARKGDVAYKVCVES